LYVEAMIEASGVHLDTVAELARECA